MVGVTGSIPVAPTTWIIARFHVIEGALEMRVAVVHEWFVSVAGSESASRRLRDGGIDPERRPQTLSLDEWEAVYREFGPGSGARYLQSP